MGILFLIGWSKIKIALTISVYSHHYPDYDEQNFILVPSEENLNLMIEFETKDMDQRLKAIEARHPDPGRSVPVHTQLLSVDSLLLILSAQPFDMMCEYAFLHSTHADVRVIREFTEARDDPGALPQVVTYTFFNHRVLTIGPANVWIDRRGTNYIRFMLRLDVNPFALIANALLGLHSAFVEPQLWLDGDSPENDSSQPFVSRVSLLASKLLTLRNLYNRCPDEIIGTSIEAQEPKPYLLIATG